jgi:SAM-dependent methyltransferase
MQMGLDEHFHYQHCGACGSMQLLDIPSDLGKYYPNKDYYSFQPGPAIQKKADILRKIKADYLLYGKNKLLGSLLSIGYTMPEEWQWMKDANAQFNDAILDIGTGNGTLLARLFKIGFSNLTGIDPFVDESRDLGPIKILKKDIYEVTEQYDVVMMHHSLEHMFEPQQVMMQAMKITKPGGLVMVRIPVMGNYGWNTYGVFWGGIDGPRHIFIPSEKQLRLLGERAGFTIEKFYYDSPVSMIWLSEQHKNGMHLYHPNSYMFRSENGMFTKEDIKRFKSILEAENEKGNGDTAVMCLRKPG